MNGSRRLTFRASASSPTWSPPIATYSIDEAAGVVVHHVELDLSPNRISTDGKRAFKLSGDRLELHPSPPWPAGVRDWTVTWERVR